MAFATVTFDTVDQLVKTTGNPYAYTQGNPLQFADPLGLFDWAGLGQDIGASTINVMVNFGRGITMGLTDDIANYLSPGASCMVDHTSAQARFSQGLGFLAINVATFGSGSTAATTGAAGRTTANAGAGARGAETGAQTAHEVTSGIYVVKPSKGVYVGQSGNIPQRLAQHVRDGKSTPQGAAGAARQGVAGSRIDREIAEQLLIDRLGAWVN